MLSNLFAFKSTGKAKTSIQHKKKFNHQLRIYRGKITEGYENKIPLQTTKTTKPLKLGS